MALIKCPVCGREISDHAKMCPNCGYERNMIFCPDCGKEISSRATVCPNCGRAIMAVSNKGENYGMSIAAFVCSFFWIANIVGLILGIIVLNANKGKSNTARSFGLAAVIISGISLAFIVIFLLFGIAVSTGRVYY